ncbi:MAG: hypothetical protein WD768_01950 [Phycisphaeraceae bacterium]
MYLKSIAMILCLAATGAAILSLRQQRWQVEHQVANMHRQIENARRSVWESQVKVTAQLKPAALEHRIEMANLDLMPLTGAPPAPPQPAPQPARTPRRR